MAKKITNTLQQVLKNIYCWPLIVFNTGVGDDTEYYGGLTTNIMFVGQPKVTSLCSEQYTLIEVLYCIIISPHD